MLAVSAPTILSFAPAEFWPTQADGTTLPLAIFHGLGDCCLYPGMSDFTKHMNSKLGNYATCVEIGNGTLTSWLDGF